MSATRFVMPAVPEAREYLDDIADDMVTRFGIPLAEAVARINEHWEGRSFDSEDDLIFHEMPGFWAVFLYYGDEARLQNPDADHSGLTPLSAPPKNSSAWTL